jgi:uncharacterized membrane protein
MSQVGIQSGGCNPVPVPPAYQTVTENTITISKDFLNEAKALFARWRRS